MHCKRLEEPTAQERAYLKRAKDDAPVTSLNRAAGCEHCNHIGYRGRVGVHEMLEMTNRLRQQISEGAGADVVNMTARNQGMRTLFEDCAEKVKAGVTSLEEALRVSALDEFA